MNKLKLFLAAVCFVAAQFGAAPNVRANAVIDERGCWNGQEWIDCMTPKQPQSGPKASEIYAVVGGAAFLTVASIIGLLIIRKKYAISR